MYVTEFQIEIEFCCQCVQVATVKMYSLVQEVNAARYNNYCSALTFLGFSFSLTNQCTCALGMFTDDGLFTPN